VEGYEGVKGNRKWVQVPAQEAGVLIERASLRLRSRLRTFSRAGWHVFLLTTVSWAVCYGLNSGPPDLCDMSVRVVEASERNESDGRLYSV
jgi:hypothetical protein